eukprot:TRINITY_DN2103_c0_g1_i3.p1 TRINITY_DN2103_c0_g1~~TRINITY_DN2103_c0_g1_i3.p1  ORF type:complete len:472 (+),score=132.61 TRINITY_DN2103_c0_g1_i3:56-1417(+)
MREIIHLQVGQCGNQIGTKFWEVITEEHGISKSGHYIGKDEELMKRSDVYFREGNGGIYVPRAVLVDLETGVLDNIRSEPMGKLFRPDNFIFGKNSAGNNWAKGHYTEGAELCEGVMEVVRKEVEDTDTFQGFQMCHSIGGGTGSGMGTLILQKLKEDYPDRMILNYSVFPSQKMSDVVVEPYNSLLTIHQLIENSTATMAFDNEALYNITTKNLGLKTANYQSLNSLISSVMSGITCSLRFTGQLNSDIRKLAVNLIPFPRLSFFCVAHSPLSTVKNLTFDSVNVQEVSQQLFNGDNLMSACDLKSGKFLTSSLIYRGKISAKEVDDYVMKVMSKKSENFVDWIPNNIKTSLCNVAPKGFPLSGTMIANTTSIQKIIKRVKEQFSAMFKKKAFLHWYTGEGMEEMEFSEAESNINDLLNEYQQYESSDSESGNNTTNNTSLNNSHNNSQDHN